MMKKLIVVLALALMISGSVLSASAEEVSAVENQVVEQSGENSGTIAPMADKIVTKFRVYNGKYQYRHWNETRGYWVEPDWITYA